MIIEKDETELVNSLHKLADWVEKDNNVQCHSVPRKAAYTITRLTEENNQLRLQLNKHDYGFSDYINRAIGMVRLYIYLAKKKWKS
jgi:hypothetical protein